MKSKRRKTEKDEHKSQNEPCRSESTGSKRKTKDSQELGGEHQGENIQVETDAAAPLEEKIDYVEETAIAMQVILEIMAQKEKCEFQLLFDDNM